MTEQIILLFDIDGTLLLTGGAGNRSLNHAIETVTGLAEGMNDVIPDGKTDYLIIEEAFRLNFPDKVLSPEHVEKVLQAYEQVMENELERSERFRLMPGVPDILEACLKRKELVLGLATGNLENTSWMKLHRGKLQEYFSFGGFGSDARDRTDMVRKAIRRACEYTGQELRLENIYVIGDTPHDILCAHEAGIRAIGVGAARFNCDELAHYHPEGLLPDLKSPDALFRLLGL